MRQSAARCVVWRDSLRCRIRSALCAVPNLESQGRCKRCAASCCCQFSDRAFVVCRTSASATGSSCRLVLGNVLPRLLPPAVRQAHFIMCVLLACAQPSSSCACAAACSGVLWHANRGVLARFRAVPGAYEQLVRQQSGASERPSSFPVLQLATVCIRRGGWRTSKIAGVGASSHPLSNRLRFAVLAVSAFTPQCICQAREQRLQRAFETNQRRLCRSFYLNVRTSNKSLQC